MLEGYREFEASSLYCPRCRKAVTVRKKLLLVLPTGTKYDYLCAECGAPVGQKVDQDPAEFRRSVPPHPSGAPARSGAAPARPVLPQRPGLPPGSFPPEGRRS
jgi:hypothetical protein